MNIYDIADKAGVSIATVSRVINGTGSVSEKTRKKVQDVMRDLGYTPNVFARGLMVNSMKTIGVMTIDVSDLYYAGAIQTIETEIRKSGYGVILCSSGENIEEKKKYLKLLLQKGVDGIMLVGSVFKEKTDNSHIMEAALKVPVIMVNGDVEGKNIFSIVCDDSYGVYSTVDFLINKGHRDIVYIYDVDTFSGFEKLKGFKNAVKDRGLIFGQYSIIKTEKGIDGGYNAAAKLLEQGMKFSAVITAEDILAAGILKKFREAGVKVPEDAAVVGFNNSIISRSTSPELTSIDSKVEAISSNAVKILLDAFESRNIPSKTVIMPELVVRNTT